MRPGSKRIFAFERSCEGMRRVRIRIEGNTQTGIIYVVTFEIYFETENIIKSIAQSKAVRDASPCCHKFIGTHERHRVTNRYTSWSCRILMVNT